MTAKTLVRILALTAAALLACVYDPDRPCGPFQERPANQDICVCVATAAPTSKGCVPCGTNETPMGNTCVCKLGFERQGSAGCVEKPTGLSAACSPAGAACPDPAFPYCAMPKAGDGYCSKRDCETTRDCPAGWTCATWEKPAYCFRPATGLGKPCTNSSECAGQDADYCETLMAHACLVSACSTAPDSCQTGFECCPLKNFGLPNLCVPTGRCPK